MSIANFLQSKLGVLAHVSRHQYPLHYSRSGARTWPNSPAADQLSSSQGAAGGTLGDACSVVLQPDTGNFGSIYGEIGVIGAGDKDMAQPERFTLRKGESTKKPWIVEDTHANPSEDAVLYHFPTKAKANSFKAEMEAEHCQSPSFPIA